MVMLGGHESRGKNIVEAPSAWPGRQRWSSKTLTQKQLERIGLDGKFVQEGQGSVSVNVVLRSWKRCERSRTSIFQAWARQASRAS